MTGAELISAVTRLEAAAQPREKVNMPAVVIPSAIVPDFMRTMRDDPQLAFDMLCTHTAVDRIGEGRFELLYVLYSTKHRHSLTVSAMIPRENPEVGSVSGVWAVAEWQEREVYDLLGVLYANHPDLRRLLLEDDWKGFPLRKDYKDDFMLELPK
ncbi:MAG: NADH-quinone oxidoreductase subunit C [bacterium]